MAYSNQQQQHYQQQQHPSGGYAHQYSPNMYPAQPQQMYSQGAGAGVQYSGSQPTLPRYASNGSNMSNAYPQSPNGTHSPSSPLNPAAAANNNRGGPNTNPGMYGGHGHGHGSQNSGLNSRYSTYGYGNGGPGAQGGAHPLSNALYADSPSSPTLAGDESEMDEKKGLQSFPPSSSSSGSGSDNSRTRNNLASKNNTGIYKRWSGAFIGDSGRDARHSKPERLGWLDGMRFIVACIALNGTFFGATITNENSYTAIQRSSPLYIFRSFGLALTFFLLILGRALSAPLWDISTSGANAGSVGISFPRLTRAMLTRTFRFILPVLVVAALLWGLGASNATSDCNPAGMQQPYWNLIARFSGYMTVVFNCFYAFEYQTVAAQTFAGNLWTNAWFFQSSFAVYIVHTMLGNLSSSRFWIYGILGFFMWCTNNYFCIAIIGLAFSDIAAHGHFARMRKWPFIRVLAIQIILIGIALAIQFVNVVRNNLNAAFRTLNVLGHDELTISDLIFAVCFLFAFETSPILQVVFGNVVMRLLGKLAPGIYLLAPAITYTVVPSLGISLRNSGSGGSAILGVTWVVCFAICVVAAIPFHFLVELPSKLAGEYFADFVENWGRDPAEEGKSGVKGPQKSAPKKISGPGAK